MAAKKGLGKGLDSLIAPKAADAKPAQAAPQEAAKPVSEHAADAVMMDINKVEPNRDQPRKKFDEDALNDLADSIKQFGVLQPLLVQERDDYYEIIAGERRWRAAKKAGIKQLPVIIKKLTEQEIMEISLIENIQREDLNPIEEALAYKRLLTEFNLKQDEVADRVSKSRTTITNSMRLLKLSEKVQQMVIDDKLTTGHVRPLISVEDEEQQIMLAEKIFDEKLSVRDAERLVKNLQTEKKAKPDEKKALDPQLLAVYQDLEEQMKRILGTKVSINHKDEKQGRLEIEYYSQDELDRIIDLLRTVQR
ncbi:MAG: ParB/RepB/Spo0J family partition protein [Agathobacter sp.]|nr:ParB/RepB/Spo0J family partition protein [Agathobacter sp.]